MNHKNKNRRGITLVELLVVITIMMILAAIVLPQLKFGTEGQKIRESARIVSTYLNAARNKAIETGRPCGVMFERIDELTIDSNIDGDPSTTEPDSSVASVQMSLIQVPAPYVGDAADCRIVMEYDIDGKVVGVLSGADFRREMISIGDRIQFDHKGPWYSIDGQDKYINKDMTIEVPEKKTDGLIDPQVDPSLSPGDDTNDWLPPASGILPMGDDVPEIQLTFKLLSGQRGNPPFASLVGKRLSFQIMRQATSTISRYEDFQRITRSMTPPQKLPRGTAIDFTASGIDDMFFSNCNFPVAIVFSPSGSVKQVYGFGMKGILPLKGETFIRTGPHNHPFIGPIYLLVGQELQIPGAHGVEWYQDPDIEENDKRPNWQNPESRWVVISPTTGMSTVAQNTVISDPAEWDPKPKDTDKPTGGEGISAARKMASEGLDGGDRR